MLNLVDFTDSFNEFLCNKNEQLNKYKFYRIRCYYRSHFGSSDKSENRPFFYNEGGPPESHETRGVRGSHAEGHRVVLPSRRGFSRARIDRRQLIDQLGKHLAESPPYRAHYSSRLDRRDPPEQAHEALPG